MNNHNEPDWEDEFFPSKNKKDLDPYFDEEPDEEGLQQALKLL